MAGKIGRSSKDAVTETKTLPVGRSTAPGGKGVAYKGAVPLKSFIGWVGLVVGIALVVGFLAAQLLVNQRLGQLVEETASRVELQGQGRSAVVGEWLSGVAKMADSVANAETVRLFVAEMGKGAVSGDAQLLAAMEAQKPYMEALLREFVAKNKMQGGQIVLPDGQILMGHGVVPEVVRDRTIVASLVREGQAVFRPLRLVDGVVVMDVVRPIRAPGLNGADGQVLALLWLAMPVGDKLSELVAATPLDRKGERTAMVQDVGGNAMVVGRTALADLNEPFAELVERLGNGRVVQESVVDGKPVFATLKQVMGTPLALLQEYASGEALAMMGIYKPGLFMIVTLLVVVLSALMLALTLHLMGQRNKTRVKLLGQTMEALVRVVEARDPYLSGHHSRVARLAVQVGNHLRLGVGERASLYYAAQLAAVGRMLVRRDVLSKKGKLSANERREMEDHVSQAVAILGQLDFDLPVVDVIRQMYERVDGSGHPYGLKGDQMNEMAKVLGACDAYVAMTSDRAHRKALGRDDALRAMGGGAFGREIVGAIRAVERK